jgi:Protein of unknown function (DUF642)
MPVISGPYQTILPGSEPPGFGWRVTSGNADVAVQGALGIVNNVFDGLQVLDLDGTVAGAIAQTFATKAGTTYVLMFAYANNFGSGGTNPARATVSVADTTTGANLVAPIAISHGASTSNNLNWTSSSAIEFGAQGATTTLSFTSNDPSTSDGGILLDAVSIAQLTPAPNVTQILPQFAFGGGWYSALYFTNITSSPVSFSISFIGDDGNPLNLFSLGSSTTVNVAARGTSVIEAPNAGPLNQGYVSVSLPSGVIGDGVFRQSVAARADQEAVVPLLSSSSTTSTLVWDDTNYTTSVAIANPSSTPITVSITAWDVSGSVIGTSSISLAPRSKTEAVLHTLPGLAGMVGTRGSATFVVPFGNVSVLGLRFNGTAFTSIPPVQN